MKAKGIWDYSEGRIIGLDNPQQNDEAATRGYVINEVENLSFNQLLNQQPATAIIQDKNFVIDATRSLDNLNSKISQTPLSTTITLLDGITERSKLTITQNALEMKHQMSKVEITSIDPGVVKINTNGGRGAEYADNYSASFTNRSLVDKEYVDNIPLNIVRYFASQDGFITTTNRNFINTPGTDITPPAGTYWCFAECDIHLESINNNARSCAICVTRDTEAPNPENIKEAYLRRIGNGSVRATINTCTSGFITVNGSQIIRIRWRAITGTANMYKRKLTLIKVQD